MAPADRVRAVCRAPSPPDFVHRLVDRNAERLRFWTLAESLGHLESCKLRQSGMAGVCASLQCQCAV